MSSIHPSPSSVLIRRATQEDVAAMLGIFNQAIERGDANTEVVPKDLEFMREWVARHDDRYAVFVAQGDDQRTLGYASLNAYFPERSAYRGVADVSYYVAGDAQGMGVGTQLMQAVLEHAQRRGFHKCVVRTFPTNVASLALLRRFGFRQVGVFEDDAMVNGEKRSVAALEKLF